MESIIDSSKPPHVSNPRKPTLPSSFSFRIRAPLTLDDDTDGSDCEPNDNKFANTSTTSSVYDSGSELVEATVEQEDEEEEDGGNPKWVRPIAKLSCDDDDDDYGDGESSDLVGSEVEFGDSFGVVEKISIAPRIKVFGDEIEEKGVEENVEVFLEANEKLKVEEFDVVAGDSNGSELRNGEKGVDENGLGVSLVASEKLKVENFDVVAGDSNDSELRNDEKGVEDNDLGVSLVASEKLKVEEFDVVAEDSNDSELQNDEKGVVEGEEVKECVVEESGVCQSRNDKSLDVDEMLEREVSLDIDFDHAKNVSVADAAEFGGKEFEGNGNELDLSRFYQAEETAETGKCDFSEIIDVEGYENVLYSDSSLDHTVKLVADVDEGCDEKEIEEEEEEDKRSSVSDEDAAADEIAEQIMNEIEQRLAAELDTDSEGEGEELFDSAALMAILDATTSVNGSRVLSVDDLIGKLAPQQTFTPSELGVEDEPEKLSDEEKKRIEKMRLLRVSYLRLVHRLGISLEDSMAMEVLDGLALAYGEHNGHFGALESAKRMALNLEAEKGTDLDFCLNILVLGKSGVGKSATINFIFGEKKAAIHAFEPATTSLKEIVGTVDGIKIKILDTPGLKVPAIEQTANQKILAAVSKFMKKSPPDVILYVDRLDTETGDNDLPMLKSITRALGSSVWRKTIVTLTHSASSPPDGPLGLPLSHDIFVAQKSRVVLQSISKAAGNKHLLNPSFMCPVSLVENSPMFPQGSRKRSQLLLLCYSKKVLSEVSCFSPPKHSSDWRRFLRLPLSYLLSSLFQSYPHPKLGDGADSYIEFGGLCDSESEEDEDEYDKLPSFRPLRKSQVAKLNKEQRKAYFEEYDYCVKLLERKQWREAVKRLREIKNKGKDGANFGDDISEDVDEEALKFNPASESLPPSFDGDDHTYRYWSLAPASRLLVGPVSETHSWDHDCGWDGVSLVRDFAIAHRIPASFHVIITKDKNELNIHLNSSLSLKHEERGSTLARLDIDTFGIQLVYILRGETEVRNFKINKTTAGLIVTLVGENLAAGLKIEDQIEVGKRLVLAAGAGGVQSNGDTAYGANFEVRLKEKDFPVGQEDQSSLGLSLMKWRGDLALTATVQSRFSIGRSSKMAVYFGLNNERRGKISVKTSSSDQLPIALAGILPILVSIIGSIFSGFAAQN
ncbi:hypothetical protein TIFTF001_015590 [Ficus carica]|uniref:AIG1-type G domain-containing protein n=1 Tax=Ficus carica TaxID=3494 RepID=A0AA88A5Y0_FICCA|nr:hypothetical protein TIFTF001_015590 [Ficus carica]